MDDDQLELHEGHRNIGYRFENFTLKHPIDTEKVAPKKSPQ
jgi:hypothetical protein